MINVPSTLNTLLRHVRSLIPFVIVISTTRQALVKVSDEDKDISFNVERNDSFLGIDSDLVDIIG